MNNPNMEEWLHSSDEERADIHRGWNVNGGEGKDIVSEIAGYFKDECVYNVDKVGVANHNGQWVIEAFVEADDYDTLKDRKNVTFLGFKIVFLPIG